VAAFEPDPENFRALSRWVGEKCPGINATLFQRGLGAASSSRRFQQGDAAGSAISESGESMIEIVALDEVLPDFAPTFIKLDIEGAEIDALNGAADTIRKYHPRIAACVYHLPEHLWEVPLLLRKLLPSHSLHLRYHGFNGFDAVAYAIEP
jgi:FkbM family methyltransferase